MRPVQHLMRQPMLVGGVLEYTEKEHPDHEKLVGAAAKMQSVVDEINEKKRRHEQQLKLVQLHHRLRGDFPERELVQPARQLLLEGGVLEVSRGSGSAARRHLLRTAGYIFLCNDSLWYSEVLRGNRYKLQHVFDFTKQRQDNIAAGTSLRMRSAGVADSAHVGQVRVKLMAAGESFRISDPQFVLELRPQGESAERWVETIEDALNASRPAFAAGPYNVPEPSSAYIEEYVSRHKLQNGSNDVEK